MNVPAPTTTTGPETPGGPSRSGTAPRVRVLVVSPPAPVWGAQLYLLGTVDALAARGIDLTLASPARSPFAEAWRARGYAWVDAELAEHGGLRRADGTGRRPGPRAVLADSAAVVRSLARVARLAGDYDVVHSYTLASHVEVALAARLRRRPAVLDLVNIVKPGLGRRVLSLAARLASLTVANSSATASTVGAGARVQVIQPGIDLGRFRPGEADPAVRAELTSDPDAPLVAIIGRVDVNKGIQVLVEAMAALQGDAARAHLVVVGEVGTGRQDFGAGLRRDAEALLGDRVRFTGRRNDIPDVMRAVDVMVNASRAEPFGLSALEAQACGTPVIGTNAGGIPEFVEHGVTGLLVPPFEVGPLVAALERVLGDDALVRSMTIEAERRVNPARGLEAQYDELADMYRSVARVSRRRA